MTRQQEEPFVFTRNADGSSFFVFMNQKRKDDLIEEKKQTESLERCMYSDHGRSCHHRVHSRNMAVLAANCGIRSLEHKVSQGFGSSG